MSRESVVKLLKLGTLGVVLAVSLLEMLCRTVVPVRPPLVQADSELGYVPIPNLSTVVAHAEYSHLYRSNNRGLHDREYGPKKPGVRRILVVGDSFVHGVELPWEKNLTKVAEARLAQAGVKAELVNFGVGGYGTGQELLFLERHGWMHNPDMVLLAVSDNDFADNVKALKGSDFLPYFQVNSNGQLLVQAPQRSVRIDLSVPLARQPLRSLQFARQVLRGDGFRRLLVAVGLSAADASPSLEATLASYLLEPSDSVQKAREVTKVLILEMRRRAEKRGLEFRLMLVPGKLRVQETAMKEVLKSNSSQPSIDKELVGRFYSELARSHQIPFLDLGDSYPGEFFFQNDVHWNEDGHSLAGNRLAEFLLHPAETEPAPGRPRP